MTDEKPRRGRPRKSDQDVNPAHYTRQRTAQTSTKKGVRTYRKYYYAEGDKLIFVQEKYDPNNGGKECMRRHRTYAGKVSKNKELIEELKKKKLFRASEDVRAEREAKIEANRLAEEQALAALDESLED